jgi:hypothetical protein
VLQVDRDGTPRRSQLPAIVSIASICIGANPLARMHLQRRGAGADHIPRLSSGIARCADSFELPFRRRKCRVAGQSRLSWRLPGGIDIKDEVATPLPVEDAATRFGDPPRGLAVLLGESPRGFDARTINIGQYVKAEPLFQCVLSIYEQELGASHPNTLTSLSRLAAFYQEQGKYEQAELLYQRVLSIYEQELGTSPSDMATSLDNLAGLYYAQAGCRATRHCAQQERKERLVCTRPDGDRTSDRDA